MEPDEITLEVIGQVIVHCENHFGDITDFHLAVTRLGALSALKQFIQERLVHFGDYQDAMLMHEPWMYHSHISFYLNAGLLSPTECIEAALDAYDKKHVSLSSVEGFIRQILGWREYVRGIYWNKMPDYKHLNFLQATRKLPDFYWGSDTKMACLKQCVGQTKTHAYAHHIQRLMILGNFALLTGIHPDEVNAWFMIVYPDAYEWVVLPNVTGMILFADGGFLASKPYAAGGNYINKMSDYCKNCVYKVSVKTGPDACPFNYLYWNFLQEHRKTLSRNPRIGMLYKTYDRMSESQQHAIHHDSRKFLDNMTHHHLV
jgi:deoxyribodipyrimidine photolyase-related protein